MTCLVKILPHHQRLTQRVQSTLPIPPWETLLRNMGLPDTSHSPATPHSRHSAVLKGNRAWSTGGESATTWFGCSSEQISLWNLTLHPNSLHHRHLLRTRADPLRAAPLRTAPLRAAPPAASDQKRRQQIQRLPEANKYVAPAVPTLLMPSAKATWTVCFPRGGS